MSDTVIHNYQMYISAMDLKIFLNVNMLFMYK